MRERKEDGRRNETELCNKRYSVYCAKKGMIPKAINATRPVIVGIRS